MINIESINTELLRINNDISIRLSHLERERSEILRSINKARSEFGDQYPGQALVQTLYQTLDNLARADNSLYVLKADIQDYIRQISK